MRRLLLALACLLALPASADAAFVTSSGGGLSYVAAQGERNDATIAFADGRWSIADGGATIQPGGGCRLVDGSGHRAECDASGDLPRARVDAGDEADVVRLGLPAPAPFTLTTQTFVTGGAGDDRVEGSEAADSIGGGDGDDVLLGLGEGDDLSGGAGDDRLEGGDDLVRSGYSFDDSTPVAAGLADQLRGGPGADVMLGGPGIGDLVFYNERDVGVRVTLDSAADDGQAGELDLVGDDVEGVVGGNSSDRITGSAAANGLFGGRGNDVLDGGGGFHDVAFGGEGNDLVRLQDGAPEGRGTAGIAPGSGRYDDVFGCGGELGSSGDTVLADAGDRVTVPALLFGCESVFLDSAPLHVPRGSRSVVAEAECPLVHGARSCTGELELRVARSPLSSRPVAIGTRSFTARTSGPRRVRVLLTSAGRRLVARRGARAWVAFAYTAAR